MNNAYISLHDVVSVTTDRYVIEDSGTSVLKLIVLDSHGYRHDMTLFGPHGNSDFIEITEKD